MRWSLILHRYLGLTAAVFLVIAGLSGSVLVFADDYDRWTHPSIWRIEPTAKRLPEQELADRVSQNLHSHSSPAQIDHIDLGNESTPQVFVLSNGARVLVNPYNGSIITTLDRSGRLDPVMSAVRQVHVRLMAGNAGEWIVDAGTTAVLLIVPTGGWLWWKKKRLTVRFGRSFRRAVFDLHNVSGFYASAFVVFVSSTGLFLVFEQPIASMFGAHELRLGAAPHSIAPRRTRTIALDELIARAEGALPGATVTQIDLPARATSAVRLQMEGPGWFAHSTVFLDRYSGAVLRVGDFDHLPRTNRLRAIDEAVHMGKFAGMLGKTLMFLSSLALVFLGITGTVMWWQRTCV